MHIYTKLSRGAATALVLVLVLGVGPVAVYAEDGSSGGSGSSSETTTTEPTNDSTSESTTEDQSTGQTTETRGEKLRTEIEQLRQERQDNKQNRLEANKLRVCEARKVRIQAIMTRSITRAERQLALFTKIADRVETFYQNKGYNVANYDQLVAAVNAAKADAEANLATLKSQGSFDCSASDPKGDAQAFKLALKSINQSLKDYRTAVKNLIVAVKSANPGQDQEKQS